MMLMLLFTTRHTRFSKPEKIGEIGACFRLGCFPNRKRCCLLIGVINSIDGSGISGFITIRVIKGLL